MKPNGITTSALNLLGAIDHSRYDVTALLPKRRGSTDPLVQARIPPPRCVRCSASAA